MSSAAASRRARQLRDAPLCCDSFHFNFLPFNKPADCHGSVIAETSTLLSSFVQLPIPQLPLVQHAGIHIGVISHFNYEECKGSNDFVDVGARRVPLALPGCRPEDVSPLEARMGRSSFRLCGKVTVTAVQSFMLPGELTAAGQSGVAPLAPLCTALQLILSCMTLAEVPVIQRKLMVMDEPKLALSDKAAIDPAGELWRGAKEAPLDEAPTTPTLQVY